VAVAMLMMAPAIASNYGTMGAFVATIIPIVALTAVANGIIAQILYIPASRTLQRIRTVDTGNRVRPFSPPTTSSGAQGSALCARDFSYTYEGEEQPALRQNNALPCVCGSAPSRIRRLNFRRNLSVGQRHR
jgi:ABC-type transport system involved in cytochrome bd biosynthesis fused ATPase/permease subunit